MKSDRPKVRHLVAEAGRVLRVLWFGLFATSATALFLGRFSLAFVALGTLALTLPPIVLANRLSVRLPMPFLIGITLFVVASVFFGEALDFYNRVWWWDLALHSSAAVGFGILGFLFVFMLYGFVTSRVVVWAVTLVVMLYGQ